MFPVYAGVIPVHALWPKNRQCVPRVCGGDPVINSTNIEIDEVFPVYAGVILEAEATLHKNGSVPRVCGGDPSQSKR